MSIICVVLVISALHVLMVMGEAFGFWLTAAIVTAIVWILNQPIKKSQQQKGMGNEDQGHNSTQSR